MWVHYDVIPENTDFNKAVMTRVAVIGNACGGKSTMCRKLSTALNIPLFSVDKIQWKPGWKPAPDDEVRTQHDRIIWFFHGLVKGVEGKGNMTKDLKRSDPGGEYVRIHSPRGICRQRYG